MFDLIDKFKKLFKAKLIYGRPKKRNILFFDCQNSKIIEKQFKKNTYETLTVRGESLNVNIILKMLMNFNLSFKSYVFHYISYVSPKIIITFTDNSIFFYKFKKMFPHIIFIAVQNGVRLKHESIFDELRGDCSKKNLQADYIFTFGKAINDEYLKYIKFNPVFLGSFRNNLVPISKKNEKKKSILFISAWRSYFRNKKKNIENRYYSVEDKLLPLIIEFCENFKIKFCIAGCSISDWQQEKEYYSKMINKGKWSFIRRKNELSNYKLIDRFEVIAFTHSTLGYEALARNKKIVTFSCANSREFRSSSPFGWPLKIRKNFFNSKSLTKSEVFRVLKNVVFISKRQWNKNYQKFFKEIINFDSNNKKFINLIKKN